MKNIQVIDGAENTQYAIYEVDDEGFALLFPDPGQDVEFVDDAFERLGKKVLNEILVPAWKRKLDKKLVNGIHGTLFYGLEFKKEYYPTKRESEMVGY